MNAALGRLRHRVQHEDSGVSLIESLVVMMLSALMMTIAGTMFMTVSTQTAKAEDIRRSTADASNIMNVVSTSVRASVRNAVANSATPDPAVVVGTPTSVTVISYTDAGPSFETPLQLRYWVDAEGRMIEDRWNPSVVNGYTVFPDVSSTPTATRVLGNVVVNTSGEPIFRYFDAAGTELSASGTGLSETSRAAVVEVLFVVRVRADGSDEVVELHNRIGMPNMNFGQVTG
jgi:prepilin-type N-terminal cleavage/methylation domain-containing protein